VAGEIAALICATSPGENACPREGGECPVLQAPDLGAQQLDFHTQLADPLVGGGETGLNRIVVGPFLQAGIHGRQGLAAPAFQPVGLDADLPRDRIERFSAQQPDDDLAFAGRVLALDDLRPGLLAGARRQLRVVLRILHRSFHMDNPVSNFIDGRSLRGLGALP
jgi:hypothetical protein